MKERKIIFYVKGFGRGVVITDQNPTDPLNTTVDKFSEIMKGKSVFSVDTKNDIFIGKSDEISCVCIQKSDFDKEESLDEITFDETVNVEEDTVIIKNNKTNKNKSESLPPLVDDYDLDEEDDFQFDLDLDN